MTVCNICDHIFEDDGKHQCPSKTSDQVQQDAVRERLIDLEYDSFIKRGLAIGFTDDQIDFLEEYIFEHRMKVPNAVRKIELLPELGYIFQPGEPVPRHQVDIYRLWNKLNEIIEIINKN